MRSAQRAASKSKGKARDEKNLKGAVRVVVKPAGYPLRGVYQEYPEMAEFDVFESYAREQWKGFTVRRGDYLFDRRMFPDFAFKVIEVEPNVSVIGSTTRFIVEDYEREILLPSEVKSVSFDDIIGQEEAKAKCKLIEKYLVEPERFGDWAPRNVLFHGPAGTGKTMTARAMASTTGVPLIPVKATQLIGEFVGDGARSIHQLYDRAEELAPCIVFIDELDAIALDRRYQDIRGDVAEIVNALLTEMDGINPRTGVCTIGATNRAIALDPAVHSRFEEEIEFKLPNPQERLKILEKHVKTFPIETKNLDLKLIAKKTPGLSGRDLVEKILKPALHQAIIQDTPVLQAYLENALAKITKSRKEPTWMFI